jgi:ABC-type glycerol-3-phosphate transport system substrate-binding protein
MRFTDLIKEQKLPEPPQTYAEELEKKLKEALEKKEVKFTPLQLAMMEGGH